MLSITFAHLSSFCVSSFRRITGSGSPKTFDSFTYLLVNRLFIFVFHLLFFIISSSFSFFYSHSRSQVFSGELSLLHYSFIPSNSMFSFDSNSSSFAIGMVVCDWWVVDLFTLLKVLPAQSSPWMFSPTKDLLLEWVFPFVEIELCFVLLLLWEWGLRVNENWWAISGARSLFFLWHDKLLF